MKRTNAYSTSTQAIIILETATTSLTITPSTTIHNSFKDKYNCHIPTNNKISQIALRKAKSKEQKHYSNLKNYSKIFFYYNQQEQVVSIP